MAFIEQHDARVTSFLGNKKIFTKLFKDKKVEKFNDYPILFGIELEYEVINKNEGEELARIYRTQVANRLEPTYKDFAIAKHDGSMANGIEIVSVPMSLDAHRTQWKALFDIATDNGLAVRSTCGMHVHISREFLTPLHIGKMLGFIYDKNNAPLVTAIAGRARPIYTGRHGQYIEIPSRKITDVNRHNERYTALNTSGAQTIEFRIFKSTLDLNRMIQNIEFCDALMRMTWPCCASIQAIKENGIQLFSDFVRENRKTYPCLFEFLKEAGYIKWTKKIPAKYRQNIKPVVGKVVKSTMGKNIITRARAARPAARRVRPIVLR